MGRKCKFKDFDVEKDGMTITLNDVSEVAAYIGVSITSIYHKTKYYEEFDLNGYHIRCNNIVIKEDDTYYCFKRMYDIP